MDECTCFKPQGLYIATLDGREFLHCMSCGLQVRGESLSRLLVSITERLDNLEEKED